MARKKRDTEPVHTRDGLVVSYAELAPKLSEAEERGRAWILERAGALRQAPRVDRSPRPEDILELHRVMFDPIFDWAGKLRTTNVHIQGKLFVEAWDVPGALQRLCDDLRAWIECAPEDPDAAQMAEIIADAHHRFEQVHPFQDTNGRTGRVFDHYLLWIVFGLGGPTYKASPFIEYFPSEAHEVAYYAALVAADDHDPGPLQAFYTERLTAAFEDWQARIGEMLGAVVAAGAQVVAAVPVIAAAWHERWPRVVESVATAIEKLRRWFAGPTKPE